MSTPPKGESGLWRGGVPITSQQGAPGKPTVLICGWLGSVDKHLLKYANLYTEQGYSVVRCSLPTDAGMKSKFGKVQACAAAALTKAEECLKEAGGKEHFILHIFSNNGSFMYEAMLWMMKTQKKEKVPEAATYCFDHLRGVIFDSCPAFMSISSGLGAISMAVPPGPLRTGLQLLRSSVLLGWRLRGAVIVLGAWLFSRRRWKQLTVLIGLIVAAKISQRFGRPAQFWRHMLEDPLLQTPRLYVYSKNDHLTDYDPLEKLIEQRRAKGQKGLNVVCFPTSEHCGHLRNHPQKYSAEVLKFIQTGGKEVLA